MQTPSQTRPQPLFAGVPAPRRSTDEERSVQQPGASAPLYSLQPPQEVLRCLSPCKTDICSVLKDSPTSQ